MIFCKKCGYEGVYISDTCPVCKERFSLAAEDIIAIKDDIAKAKQLKEAETVTEGYHMLADAGDTEGEREWAKMLEKGNGIGVAQDIDEAMKFYRRAAEKFDPYSAYRYSELISRMNEKTGRFWLEFSAFLGADQAYIDAAKSHAKEDEDEFANHYLYVKAMSGDSDAIVMLADKYYRGNGTDEAPEYAKWYMEKLNFPPLHAIKLAIKLRSVKSKEAPNLALKDTAPLAANLLGKAKKLELEHPIFYLTNHLFERGETEYGSVVGDMYISGYGTKKNTVQGIRCLSRAAASGSSEAYMSLGKIYYEGEHAERNVKFALDCFTKAAKLGRTDAYELLGDIYHSKDFEGQDIAQAVKLYEKAANGGLESARKKAEKIIAAREEYYKKAAIAEDKNPTEAFKYYYIASAMGHAPARLDLAAAYATGRGTEKDASLAFSLYREAASEGVDEAFFPLGICYSRGHGVAFNFKEAIKNLSIADRLGDLRAKKEIMRLLENKKKRLARKLYSSAMRLIYLGKYEEAKGYLDIAEGFDHPRAIYTLGCLHEFGRGTAPSREKAYELYNRADAVGFKDFRSTYKLTILRMIKKTR